MDPKRDPSAPDDIVMENSYPSPNADEANYYATAAHRSQELEPQPGNQGNLDGQDASQHELQQLQREIQDETSSHHETAVDLAELQLAAQLTQGLAAQHQARQGVDVEDMREGHASQDVQPVHDGLDSSSGHPDQSLHVEDGLPGVQGQLQNHDPSQEHDLQEQIQAQLQNQQQHELQSTMGHPLQPQHHQYMTHSPGHTSSLANLNMHALASGNYGVSPDTIPPRKRSKVSRACDECRRKKIKCDAVSETGEQSCSNCRRSSVTCLFSRIPQKRGPSKGYIKELADRIFTIEGRLGGGEATSGTPPRQSSDSFPSPTAGDKRPFSSISSETLTPVKQASWPTEHRPIQPYRPSGARPIQNVNDLTPRAIAPASVEPEPSRPLAVVDVLPDPPQEPVREIDDNAFQIYLTQVHPVLPIFATSKARVESILSQCPTALREAYLEAFQDMIQPFQALGDEVKTSSRAAIRLLAEWEAEDPPPDKVTDLVSLQVFVMMAIRDSLISPAARTQLATVSRRSALSRAISLGVTMRLYTALPDPAPGPEFDSNSDENVSLRAWWTVFLLDRWDAIGTGSIMLVPEESTNLVPGLRPVLGTAGYSLTEVSGFLFDIGDFVRKPLCDASFDRRQIKVYERMADAILKLFKHDLPLDASSSTHPFQYLVYWHIRILSYLSSPDPYFGVLLQACRSSADVFINAGNAGLVTPLSHHFTALTVMVLLELSKVESCREDVLILLKDIADSKMLPSSYDRPIKDKILERLRPTTTGSINSQNLQQLADLATATDGTRDAIDATDTLAAGGSLISGNASLPNNCEGLGFDPQPLLLAGYLNYFSTNHNNE